MELYAFHLYANETSFCRPFYLKDLKHNEYYFNLLDKISNTYPDSEYATQLENDLNKDNYTLLKEKNASTSIFMYLIGGLLVISLLLNFILFRKQNLKKDIPLDYTKLLTPQEQNVFELMHKKHSNKNIAEQLFISVSTVKTHINNIYSKLNISSRKDVESFFE